MALQRRSFPVVLSVLTAVLAVVLGTAFAVSWPRTSDAVASDPPAAGVAAPRTQTVDESGGGVWSLPAPPDAARDPAFATRAGAVVARGSDLSIDRVSLPVPVTVEIAGETRDATSVYRLTVSAGPYMVRDMPAVLSVNGAALGTAAESEDLTQLVLYTYDPVVLTDGATLALTYGLPGAVAPQWSTTIEVL